MHCVRGLSQASPSNVKAIKATSSVRSGRASGSGAAATTHLTSPPTAPSLPNAAAHWAGPPYSGGARSTPVHTWDRSQLWAPLAAKDQFLFPLPYSTWHPPHWPLQLQPQNNSRKGRTPVSGQDGGLAVTCSPTLVGPRKYLPLPFLHAHQHVREGEQRGFQRGVVHINKTLWLVLGGG